MNKIEIQQLVPSEWKTFKQLRLEALRQDPSSFGESFSEAELKSDETWMAQSKDAFENQSKDTLIAYYDEKPVGLIFVFLREEPGFGAIGGFWVHPDYRRLGVGKALMSSAETWLSEKSVKQVTLWSNPENEASAKFYEKLGFEYTGKEKPLESDGAKSIRLMRKSLS